MRCSVCDQLESELTRLEGVYAEKVKSLRSYVDSVRQDRNHHGALQAEESAAKLNMDFARLNLERHKLNEHKTA